MNKQLPRNKTIWSRVGFDLEKQIEKDALEATQKSPYIKKTSKSDVVYWILTNFYNNKELTKLVWNLKEENKKAVEEGIKDLIK